MASGHWHELETATFASPDSTESCVDLEEIPSLTKVFVSNREPLRSRSSS